MALSGCDMLKKDIEKLIHEANTRFKNDGPTFFSQEATQLLVGESSKYIVELIALSIKFAKRDKADVVSATHVDNARNHLRPRKHRGFFKHLRTVAAALFGAGLSGVVGMISGGTSSSAGTLASLFLCTVGVFGIAWDWGRDS